MSQDARFEDASDVPLRLQALDVEDIAVFSSLVQDAVLPGREMKWDRSSQRFALLLNRFRWENSRQKGDERASPERVQSVLSFENVAMVQTQGITRTNEFVYSVLSMELDASNNDRVILKFSGDGALAITMSALSVTLSDVTRPYVAPSRQTPQHDL